MIKKISLLIMILCCGRNFDVYSSGLGSGNAIEFLLNGIIKGSKENSTISKFRYNGKDFLSATLPVKGLILSDKTQQLKQINFEIGLFVKEIYPQGPISIRILMSSKKPVSDKRFQQLLFAEIEEQLTKNQDEFPFGLSFRYGLDVDLFPGTEGLTIQLPMKSEMHEDDLELIISLIRDCIAYSQELALSPESLFKHLYGKSRNMTNFPRIN